MIPTRSVDIALRRLYNVFVHREGFNHAAGCIRPAFHANDAPAGGGIQAFRSAMIFTNQAPVGGGCGPHESVAMSGNLVGFQCMPTDAVNGNGATSADDTHLFDAYVQAFCHLGSQ